MGLTYLSTLRLKESFLPAGLENRVRLPCPAGESAFRLTIESLYPANPVLTLGLRLSNHLRFLAAPAEIPSDSPVARSCSILRPASIVSSKVNLRAG